MYNKIHGYSIHRKKKEGGELAKIMVFRDLTPYSLVYVDYFYEVPVILHNDLQCKTHQLAKQDTQDQMSKSNSRCNESVSTALQFQDSVIWRTGNMLIAAKHKKAAHNAFTTCRLQKGSDVRVPDLVIYQLKLADQMPGT